ncbi:MAG TPA: HAD family hydrolase [Rhodanobacteraceae bacterium]|nr:HAD family hydrolase [Rhodanobacteraceae bacterium]
MHILAISLDLDDTLWPIDPAIANAEQRLDDWLRAEHPEVAAAWPIPAMRELRDAMSRERPDLAHDFTAQRLLTLERAFATCGIGAEHVDTAFEVYYAARNTVECYADALPALAALSTRVPLVSISNGNADLVRIGLRHHFRHCISARDIGHAKPHAAIFRAACDRLGVPAEHVLHVGDDPLLDVAGARNAGLRTAWLNRNAAAWSHGPSPDLTLAHLGELAAWILGRAA